MNAATNYNVSHNAPRASVRRRLVNAKEVSLMTGLSLTSVYERARARELPGVVKIGRRTLFDLDQLEAFIAGGGDYAESAK